MLIGSFNPKIFQPYWFSAHELIPESEAEAADVEIVHPEVVSFSTDWLQLQVTTDRFMALTLQEPYAGMRDLVLSTFELLSHTPVQLMGLNRDVHYEMSSEEEWHSLGYRLVPRDNWENLLPRHVGMRSLTVEGVRPDNYLGYIRVKVEPSVKTQPGVYIQVNDHFQARDWKESEGCDQVMAILRETWEASSQRADALISGVLELK